MNGFVSVTWKWKESEAAAFLDLFFRFTIVSKKHGATVLCVSADLQASVTGLARRLAGSTIRMIRLRSPLV